MDVDPSIVAWARAIVLVEGMSDKAALETLAERLGILTGGVGIHIVSMGGVTNIARFIRMFGPAGLDLPTTGLCDAGEAGYVQRVLARAGYQVGESLADLAGCGFYVCDADLEDELIRAVGIEGVEQVIEINGELGSYQALCRQPEQRQRSTEQRLHRFMGSKSGRKSVYATLLVSALDLARVPEPLVQVLDHAAGWPNPPSPPHLIKPS